MITKEMLDFANHLADLSEGIAKKYFRIDNGEIAKDDDSPVTKADREIEKIIREKIAEKFPSHGIIGEEYGIKKADSDFTWILDPIDGTSSFIIGRALFGTLIALTYKGKSILGIMNQPIVGERWIGVDGQGSWFNGKKNKTRNCTEISDAVMCASSSHHFNNGDEETLKKISEEGKETKISGLLFKVPSLLHLIALKLHAIKQDPRRELQDLQDITELIRRNKINVKMPAFRDLCLKHGSERLYNMIIQYTQDKK